MASSGVLSCFITETRCDAPLSQKTNLSVLPWKTWEELGKQDIVREVVGKKESAFCAPQQAMHATAASMIPPLETAYPGISGPIEAWLDDNIIMFNLEMIEQRSKENDHWPSVYSTNTFSILK